jgi:twitching motility protein PilT
MTEERDIIEYLTMAVERGASDLHLCAGSQVMIRLHGEMVPVSEGILDADTCREMIYSIFTENQRARFEEDWELDFALMIKDLGRFRSNAHYSRGAVEAAFRHIPDAIPTLDSLALPPILHQLCKLEQGLVLVTGITGSGKTTTLAAMVDEINSSRTGIIISVEDPIEYVFQHKLCRVKQREIGSDTKSFPEALRHVLRQDPDVILISEMRDLETISAAITAAETGHLVLGTLHTIDAPKAIDRIVDAFPADQQSQIIAQLANALQAIVAQRLLPRADGKGRIVCTEVMVMNDAVRALMRDRKFQQILSMIEIGSRDGMIAFDESVSSLYASGQITYEEAVLNMRDPERLNTVPPPVMSPPAPTGAQPPPPPKKKGFFG